jgi:hypothetical protein
MSPMCSAATSTSRGAHRWAIPAEDWIRRALGAGKSVVTANKQVIAHAGPELLDEAARLEPPPSLRSGGGWRSSGGQGN